MKLKRVCAEKAPCLTRFWDSLTGVRGKDCVYAAYDVDSLDQALVTEDPKIVSDTIYELLSQSDQNCNEWHARVFAFRTGASFAGGFLNQVLSIGGAVAGLLSGAAASGVAAGNATFGAALNGINSSYYANKAIDEIDSIIQTRRQEVKAQIIARLPATSEASHLSTPTPTPTSLPPAGTMPEIAGATPSETPTSTAMTGATPTPKASVTPGPMYSGLDAKPDLIAYDSLCSLEIIGTAAPSTTPTPSATPTPSPTASPAAPATAVAPKKKA